MKRPLNPDGFGGRGGRAGDLVQAGSPRSRGAAPRSRLTPTTSAAWSRARKVRKPASGSSRKQRTCRRSSPGWSSPTIRGATSLPDLPQANYQVFVRGYGLVDSARVAAKPGQRLDLKARRRAGRTRGRAGLSGELLAEPAGDPQRENTPPRTFALETKACFSCHQVGNQCDARNCRRARLVPRRSRRGIATRRWDPTGPT